MDQNSESPGSSIILYLISFSNGPGGYIYLKTFLPIEKSIYEEMRKKTLNDYRYSETYQVKLMQ